MEVIWHGTASIELRAQSGKILFDPFIPLKGSPVTVKIEEFDGFEDIFITHGHFDHVASLPEIYGRNPEVKIYCTQTPYNTLIKKGIPRGNLVLLNFGDEVCVQGFKIRLLHGKHSKLPKARLRISYLFGAGKYPLFNPREPRVQGKRRNRFLRYRGGGEEHIDSRQSEPAQRRAIPYGKRPRDNGV